MATSRILTALLIVTLIWAGAVSVLYWQLKNNPKVIAITMDSRQTPLENIQSSELEKTLFLRQYLERYFNYDSTSFWASQASLAPMMIPTLARERLNEVQRLREKIEQKNLSQRGELLHLRQLGNRLYEAKFHLQSTEDSVRRELYLTTHLDLSVTERTIDNPWGLLISRQKFINSSTVLPSPSKELRLIPNAATLISIPCALEKIETSHDTLLQTKITTLNTSDIQISATGPLLEPVTMKLLCKDTFVELTVLQDEKKDMFLTYPTSLFKARPKPSLSAPARKKDVYDKALDDAMNLKSRF